MGFCLPSVYNATITGEEVSRIRIPVIIAAAVFFALFLSVKRAKAFKKSLLCFAGFLFITLVSVPDACAHESGPDIKSLHFAGRSWEELMDRFLQENGVLSSQVGIGYLNTVSGEEHYINADEYMPAASMYKLPLNMYFAEMIYNGQFDWEDYIGGLPYKSVLYESIVNSDNELSEQLITYIGSHGSFKKATAHYLGLDAETADSQYYSGNLYTPRQMIRCLELLHTEQERFPGIVEAMLEAKPTNYFNYRGQDYAVAHKYGYVPEGGYIYANDCAIVYTDSPIVIVMFTESVKEYEQLLSDFCTLMCDYTQYHTSRCVKLHSPTYDGSAAVQTSESGGRGGIFDFFINLFDWSERH